MTVNIISGSSYTAGITIGMTVTGDQNGWIAAGTTVQLLGTPLAPNQITLSTSPSTTGTENMYLRCDNGGTVIKDRSGYYWVRTKPAHSVLEWGAFCNGSVDDTTAIQNAEAVAEQVGDNLSVTPQPTQNGQAGTVSFPSGRTCLADQIYIQQAVSWISSGTKQAWVQQRGGRIAVGYPVNVNPAGNPGNAFIVAALSLFNTTNCSSDPGATYSPAQVTLQNVAIVGDMQTGDGGNQNNVMGMGFENAHGCVPKAQFIYFSNVSISNFQNHLLYAYNWGGVIRGYNVILWNTCGPTPACSGYSEIGGFEPSCMVLDSLAQPLRFYNLVTAKCWRGTTLNGDDGIMIDGFTAFSNAEYGFSLTGTPNGGSGNNARRGASVVLYNAESNNNGSYTGPTGSSVYGNFYVDPQGGTETLQCYWCRSQTKGAPGAADVEIGPDGQGLVFSAQGFQFSDVTLDSYPSQNLNVLFDGPATGASLCNCTTSLQGTLSPSLSQLLTNAPQLLTGPAYLLGGPPILDGNPMNGTPGWGNGIVAPQGRLTLTYGVPVMSADVSGGTTVYYSDMLGQHVPIFNGTNLVAQNFNSYFMQTVGTTTSGSATINNVGDINELAAIHAAGGTLTVTGPSIPSGETVSAATAGGTSEGSGSGTTVAGQTTITGVSYSGTIEPGWSATGSGLPNGTYVTVVNSATVITINQPASLDGTPTLYFASGGTVTLSSGTHVIANTGTQLVFSAATGDLQLPLDGSVQTQSNLFDLYVTLNPADFVPTLCTGPAWHTTLPAGSSTRGDSTKDDFIISFMGLWVNRNLMACQYGNSSGATFDCRPKQCTYVGTMLATNNGQTSMVMNPIAGTGGSANTCLCLYNAYNQVDFTATSKDLAAQYTYIGGWRATDSSPWTINSASNAIAYVDGLGQATPRATTIDALQGSQNYPQTIGITFNSPTAPPTITAVNANDFLTSASVDGTMAPTLGLNYAQAMENTPVCASCTPKFGNGAGSQALELKIRD
ncbi:MAG TPA: hypothetical protein VHX61_17280 [Rhizomicrobium sp.]|jgi:hypothetical protein|nr:hypothetical protein [Rhizomicrobium sp.]